MRCALQGIGPAAEYRDEAGRTLARFNATEPTLNVQSLTVTASMIL